MVAAGLVVARYRQLAGNIHSCRRKNITQPERHGIVGAYHRLRSRNFTAEIPPCKFLAGIVPEVPVIHSDIIKAYSVLSECALAAVQTLLRSGVVPASRQYVDVRETVNRYQMFRHFLQVGFIVGINALKSIHLPVNNNGGDFCSSYFIDCIVDYCYIPECLGCDNNAVK